MTESNSLVTEYRGVQHKPSQRQAPEPREELRGREIHRLRGPPFVPMTIEGVLDNVVTLALGGAIITSLAALFVFAYLRAAVGIVLCLAVLLLRVLMLEYPVASVAGIGLFLVDIVYMGLLTVAAIRWLHILTRGRVTSEHFTLLLLGLLLIVDFGRGVVVNGPFAAGVEFRRHFYFISGAAYFASFEGRQDRISWLLRAWLTATLLICAISLQRFVVDIGALDLGRLRVVDANATLVLAQGLLICLYLWIDSRTPNRFRNLALVILPFVVIMQHRTVWVVMMATIVVVLLLEARLRNRLLMILAIGTVLTGVGTLAVYGDRGSEILGESATDTGTFEWRLEGWRVLLDEQLRNGVDTLVGRPMGAGFERYLASLGYSVADSPHNYYIELLLVGGVLGVGFLLFIYARSLVRPLQPWPLSRSSPIRRVGIVLLVSQLVYFITYAPAPEQSILFGIALSLAVAPSSQPELVRTTDPSGLASRERAIGGARAGPHVDART